MDWTAYHPIEDMHSYLDYLETTFDFVTTESLGKSYEGSDMRVAKVCKGGCGNKPAMWIDGGIHAREWISPATVMYMLMEIVENDADHSDLTENLDWYRQLDFYTFILILLLPGIFCQWSILMVIFLPRLTTDCGARQDHLTEEVVMVLMLTVTGDSIGAQEGPPVILAQTPIWDQNHSLRWRTGM